MLKLYREFTGDLASADKRAAATMIYAAAALGCIYYAKSPQFLADATRHTRFEDFGRLVSTYPHNNLPALFYWVLIVFLFYFAIPAFFVRIVMKKPLAEFGLRLKLEEDFLKTFAVCAAVMLPIVFLVSLTASFSDKYPFFQVYDGSAYFSREFFIWEAIYFVQFFALEFFFRGFLVHSLKPSLKIYSIFVMTIPYCMIHFGKPPAETFAAIFAGVFLGWLSYKHGAIWLGLLLHCTVAFSMDVLALYHKGLLF